MEEYTHDISSLCYDRTKYNIMEDIKLWCTDITGDKGFSMYWNSPRSGPSRRMLTFYDEAHSILFSLRWGA